MDMASKCNRESEHFDAFLGCNEHTLENEALPALSNDSALIVVVMKLVDGALLA